MHRAVISKTINTDNNVFDAILHAVTMDFTKCVSNVTDMRERDSMKRKGDIWELFCKDWLLASGKYVAVYLLDEYNSQFADNNMFVSRQDNGIDILAQTTTGWHAIQCKYRSKGYVTWKMLSTFIALCERTGPWEKYIVMTNAKGVTHKLPRTPKDKSICYRSFASTPREHWMRIIGTDHQYRRLCDDSSQPTSSTIPHSIESSKTILPKPILPKPKVLKRTTKSMPKSKSITPTLTMEELRQRRLQRFESPDLE